MFLTENNFGFGYNLSNRYWGSLAEDSTDEYCGIYRCERTKYVERMVKKEKKYQEMGKNGNFKGKNRKYW